MMQSKPVVNVLFTASGRRVELIRAFRKAYVEAGIRGKIVCVDMSPLAPTLYEADAAYIMPPSEHPDYAAILAEVCAREEVHLVFPLIDGDVETLARHRTVVESSGARLIVVSDRAAEIVSDKWLTYQFFRQLEIPTPLSWLPDQLPAGSYHYPLFVKPRRGSSSKYTYKVSDEAELLCYLRRVPEPIIQQHLDGIEITTDVFCDFEGKVLGAVSRQRLETRAGEVSKGKTVFLPEVLECCLKIASALQLIGPANIQCFIVDNSFLFTEVNARFGGGAPLSFAAGANAPLWYLQLAAGLPVACPPIEAYTYGLYMTRYDETRFLCEAEYEQMASRRFRLG